MVQFPSAVQLVVTKYCNWITGSDQEGPINLGLSVHGSVALSVCLFQIYSMVFPETRHGIRGSCGDVHDRTRLFTGFFFFFFNGKWERAK